MMVILLIFVMYYVSCSNEKILLLWVNLCFVFQMSFVNQMPRIQNSCYSTKVNLTPKPSIEF